MSLKITASVKNANNSPITTVIRKAYNAPFKTETLVIEAPYQSEYTPSKNGVYFDKVKVISNNTNTIFKDIIDETKSAAYLFYYSTITNASKYIKYGDTSSATSMHYMFSNCLELTTIPLLDTSNVTNMDRMFINCRKLITIPLLDTSKVTDMNNMFNACSELTTIPLLDTSKVTTIYSMFFNCRKLITIPKLDVRKATALDYFVKDCTKLTEIWIKNIKANLQVGSGTSYGHLLTVDSLVHLCKELRNVNAARMLTVGSANLEKLASVYVKTIPITDEMRAEDDLIDEKLPCVVCESTDEGAMLISEYVQIKGWKIQ